MHMFGVKYREYEFVHQILDHGANVGIDYQRLFAAKHRKFLHDDRAIGYVTDNFGYMAGIITRGHIALDIVWSQGKREMNGSGSGKRNRR